MLLSSIIDLLRLRVNKSFLHAKRFVDPFSSFYFSLEFSSSLELN